VLSRRALPSIDEASTETNGNGGQRPPSAQIQIVQTPPPKQEPRDGEHNVCKQPVVRGEDDCSLSKEDQS